MATFNALVHILLTIPLEQKDILEETITIKSIDIANGCNSEIAKGAYINAVEEYEIYKPSKLQTDQLINDKVSFKPNLLYISSHGYWYARGHDSCRIR